MILESSPLTKRNYAIISLLIKYDLRQIYDFKISLQEIQRITLMQVITCQINLF